MAVLCKHLFIQPKPAKPFIIQTYTWRNSSSTLFFFLEKHFMKIWCQRHYRNLARKHWNQGTF